MDNTTLKSGLCVQFFCSDEQILYQNDFRNFSEKQSNSPWPLTPLIFVRRVWNIFFVGQWARMMIHKAKRHIVDTSAHFLTRPISYQCRILIAICTI